jgi:PilZ domain-containing protein
MAQTTWTGREFRRNPRKHVNFIGAIVLGDGTTPQRCKILDMSKGGAWLAVLDGKKLPSKFTLLLAMNGSVSRECKVAWRKDKEIGVQFR